MAEKRASHKPKSRRVLGHPSGRPRKLLRVGLYARVSTHDQQTIPLQTRAMRGYAARRGWTIALQVKEGDVAGGGAPSGDRRRAGVAAGPLKAGQSPIYWRPCRNWNIWTSVLCR
jgi:Resolvase, N terminal domain